MAKESLSIPEEHLAEVIEVIRQGVKAANRIDPSGFKVSKYVREQLLLWCDEETAYLKKREEKT